MSELNSNKEILDVEVLENSIKELSISQNFSKNCVEEKKYDKKIGNDILVSSNRPTSKKAIITKYKCNKGKHALVPKIEALSIEEPKNELVKEESDFIQKFNDLSVTSLPFSSSEQECSPKILERGKDPSSRSRKSSNTRCKIYSPPVQDKNVCDKRLHWNGGTLTQQTSTVAKPIITVPLEYKRHSIESQELNFGSPESGYGSPQSTSCLSPYFSDSSCQRPVELEDSSIKKIYHQLIENTEEEVHISIPPEELDDALNDVNDIIVEDFGLATSNSFPEENFISNSNESATINTNINVGPKSVYSNVVLEKDVEHISNIFHENSHMLNSYGSTCVKNNSNNNVEPKSMNTNLITMKNFELTKNGSSCNENLVSNPSGPSITNNNNVEPKNVTQNVIMILQPVIVMAQPKADVPKPKVIRPILPKPASEDGTSKASQRRSIMKLDHNKTTKFVKEILDYKREDEKREVIFIEDPVTKRSNLHLAVIKGNLERVYGIVEMHLHYQNDKPTESSKVTPDKSRKGKRNVVDALYWFDSSNKTAFDYAKETKIKTLVEYLKQAGAEPEPRK